MTAGIARIDGQHVAQVRNERSEILAEHENAAFDLLRDRAPRRQSPRSGTSACSISMSGWSALERPKDTQRPSIQVASSPSRRRNSYSSRDLPIPASPTTKTTWPWPAVACSKRFEERAQLALAPDERREAALEPDVQPAARLAGGDDLPGADGLRLPLEHELAERTRMEVARRRAAAWPRRSTTRPRSAVCCSRAAMLVVSPTAV